MWEGSSGSNQGGPITLDQSVKERLDSPPTFQRLPLAKPNWKAEGKGAVSSISLLRHRAGWKVWGGDLQGRMEKRQRGAAAILCRMVGEDPLMK